MYLINKVFSTKITRMNKTTVIALLEIWRQKEEKIKNKLGRRWKMNSKKSNRDQGS